MCILNTFENLGATNINRAQERPHFIGCPAFCIKGNFLNTRRSEMIPDLCTRRRDDFTRQGSAKGCEYQYVQPIANYEHRFTVHRAQQAFLLKIIAVPKTHALPTEGVRQFDSTDFVLTHLRHNGDL